MSSRTPPEQFLQQRKMMQSNTALSSAATAVLQFFSTQNFNDDADDFDMDMGRFASPLPQGTTGSPPRLKAYDSGIGMDEDGGDGVNRAGQERSGSRRGLDKGKGREEFHGKNEGQHEIAAAARGDGVDFEFDLSDTKDYDEEGDDGNCSLFEDDDDFLFSDPAVLALGSGITQTSLSAGAGSGLTPPPSQPLPTGVKSKIWPWEARARPGPHSISSSSLNIKEDRSKGSCRVYRMFPASRFLWLYLTEDDTKDRMRIRRWLDLTILHRVGEETLKFTFLCTSESRMKNSAVCFFAPYCDLETGNSIDHDYVLSAFGDLVPVFVKDGIGKYVSRLSLSWSETRATINLAEDQVVRIPDHFVKNHPDGYAKVYTDGCGIITEEAAREVQLSLGLSYMPSIFQIRFGGVKGILAVWSAADIRNSVGEDRYRPTAAIYIRDSQYKYQADHLRSLEINAVSGSTFKPARMQRSIIRLLECLGVNICVFEGLLKLELARLDSYVSDEEAAMRWLENMGAELHPLSADGKSKALLMLKAGHSINEPYLQYELLALRRNCLERLREKLAIPVPDSTVLFGTCDESWDAVNKETGTLLADEVTVHISGIGYLEGKVLVTRAPCSHPGDIRILTAIRPMTQSNVKDCIVFSRKGMQPVPDQISGGDLDGDKYFVCWDKSLQPPGLYPPNPRAPSTEPKTPHNHDPARLMDAMKIYIEECLTDFEIGATSNLWESWAEKDVDGPKNPYCLALSSRYEVCLDARKSGQAIPAYPDKGLRGNQRALGPIGYLQALIPDSSGPSAPSSPTPPITLDLDLLYKMHSTLWQGDKGMELFNELHSDYVGKKMARLSELIGGQPTVPISESLLSKAKAKSLYEYCDELLAGYHAEYFQAKHVHEIDDQLVLASVFYNSAYSKMTKSDPNLFRLAWLGAGQLNNLKAQSIAIATRKPMVSIAPKRIEKSSYQAQEEQEHDIDHDFNETS